MSVADSDIMIIDLNRKWIFEKKDILMKNKRTAFDEKINLADGYGKYAV